MFFTGCSSFSLTRLREWRKSAEMAQRAEWPEPDGAPVDGLVAWRACARTFASGTHALLYGVGDGLNAGCAVAVGEGPHPLKPVPTFCRVAAPTLLRTARPIAD